MAGRKQMQIITAIGDIIEEHCKKCPVKKAIRSEHGAENEMRYCIEICKIGRILREKGDELNKMDGIRKGKELTPELYEAHKRAGMLDKEIIKLYGIGMSTLTRRKKKWCVYAPRELTLEMYRGMRARGYKDKEICKALKIGHTTLTDKKREWGILR